MTIYDLGPWDHLRWNPGASKELISHRIMTIKTTHHRGPQNRSLHALMVDAPQWVNVIAVVPNQDSVPCFLMVRQYRFGLGQVTVEFPGGVVDPGEQPEVAAIRELREETGCSCGSVELLGTTNPNAAFMTNGHHSFIAREPRLDLKQQLDPSEVLDVVFVPIEAVIAGQVREFDSHGINLLMLAWYMRKEARNGI